MQRALGEVKPNSTTTGLQATNNQPDPTRAYPAQAIQFQALGTNSGSIFICDRSTPDLTKNVHVEIPTPQSSPPTRPAWSISNPAGANPLNAADYWILPAVSGDGVRITVIRT